jgi:hypothetical protein
VGLSRNGASMQLSPTTYDPMFNPMVVTLLQLGHLTSIFAPGTKQSVVYRKSNFRQT